MRIALVRRMVEGLVEDTERNMALIQKRQREITVEIDNLEKAVSQAMEAARTVIAGWDEGKAHAKLSGAAKPLANVKMTEAVKIVLRTLNVPMSPPEVKEKMDEWGYSSKEHKSDVALSVYRTLKRLRLQGRVRLQNEGVSKKPHRPVYVWIG